MSRRYSRDHVAIFEPLQSTSHWARTVATSARPPRVVMPEPTWRQLQAMFRAIGDFTTDDETSWQPRRGDRHMADSLRMVLRRQSADPELCAAAKELLALAGMDLGLKLRYENAARQNGDAVPAPAPAPPAESKDTVYRR